MMNTAAILERHKSPLVIENLLLPELGQGQVLVRMKASGICGKQLHEIDGTAGPDHFLPHLLGHEGAGVVEEVGPGVTTVKPGDHVVAHWRKGYGLEGWCPKYLRRDGGLVGGGWITTFATMPIISENRLTKIPDFVPYDVAALMGCAVTTGLGVVFNDAKLEAWQSIAVIGCGGVGLSVIMGAAYIGASPIFAIDKDMDKLTLLAWTAGATAASASMDINLKADVIVDTTGDVELMARAFSMLAPGGKLILVGQPDRGKDLVLKDFAGSMKGKTMMDSVGGGTDPNMDIPAYLAIYKTGLLPLDKLITHRVSLDDINAGIAITRSGRAGRVIVMME